MGRKRIYDEQYYEDLVTLDIEELYTRYPLEDRNKLRASQRYHKRKQMERLPDHENAPDGARKWWNVVTANPEDPENPIVTRAYAGTAINESLQEVFEPAQPAKIRPTKRKREQRLGKSILVFGDSQIGYHRVYDEEGNDSLIPTHSEEALNVIQQLNADLRPDEIVNLSDTIDLGELSRFDPQSDGFHRTLGPSFQRVHDFYAQLRADNPDAKITEPESNHTIRPTKAMMKRYPEWYGFTLPGETQPMMSYYRLANLAPLGINHIPGYGAAEYVYGEEYGVAPIVFKHGTHSSSSAGATVKKESLENPTTHVVRGHGHSFEHIARTTRDGQQLHYIQLGTTCDTKGRVPSYHSAMNEHGHPVHHQENWQNQAMYITDYNGIYQFDVIDIINGIATYNNREYNGNE